MFKQVIKKVFLIVIPVLIAIGLLFGYNNYLDEKIIELYNPALGRTYGIDEMNKGMALIENNANNGDLLIFGSSELDSSVEQNIRNLFPNNYMDCNVSIIGRASVQSMLDSVKMAALSEDISDKKVVIIISMQWFMTQEIDINGFQSHFSEVQFYNALDNSELSDNSKNYICKRVLELGKNQKALSIPYLYAYLYSNDNILSKPLYYIMQPFYSVRKSFVSLKDKISAKKVVDLFKNDPPRDIINIDWEAEMQQAEQQGLAECTNNEFYVQDSYFNDYIAPNYDNYKNMYSNVDLLKSNEINDFKQLLDICKETGVSPYFVFTPANGYYYDFTGLSKENRIALYDKLQTMTSEYRFDYIDMRDKEYEPYFLKDVMHLGRKGWLYVTKQIIEHYSEDN